MGFLPAVSKQAKKSMANTIRNWQLGRWTALSFQGIATMINPVVAGWINYYGHFYKSELIRFLEQQINPFLVKWARRQYKRFRRGSHAVRPAGSHQAGARVVRWCGRVYVSAFAPSDDLRDRVGHHHGGAPLGLACGGGRNAGDTDALLSALSDRGGTVGTGARIDSSARLPPADVPIFDLAPTAVAAKLRDRLPRWVPHGQWRIFGIF